jgi:hypothetical protein
VASRVNYIRNKENFCNFTSKRMFDEAKQILSSPVSCNRVIFHPAVILDVNRLKTTATAILYDTRTYNKTVSC